MYATLHSGSLVVGYPFSQQRSIGPLPTPSSDDHLLRSISRSYAKNHVTMFNGQPFCPGKNVHEKFKNGVVNMGEWKDHEMPLLRYSYLSNKALGFAIYTGCCKSVVAEDLDQIWEYHKKAMVMFPDWVSCITSAAFLQRRRENRKQRET